MTAFSIEIDTELGPYEFESRMHDRLLTLVLGITRIRIRQK